MAIMTILDEKKWEEVHQIIHEVLNNRKYHFNRQIILNVIKNKLEESGFDKKIMDCSYFQIMFLNTIEQFVDDEILYQIDNFYFPVKYMNLHDYHTNHCNLLYLTFNEKNEKCYIEIDNFNKTKKMDARDFLLTGGFSEQYSNKLIVPEIPIDEIASLYHDFIKEGVSKEETINLVLNYYKINFLHCGDGFINIVRIDNKKESNSKIKTLKK